MGDIVLLFVEPNAEVPREDVREKAREFGCQFLVHQDEVIPVREVRPATTPYPRLEAHWLLRRLHPFDTEDL
jgi:hypothetical protein